MRFVDFTAWAGELCLYLGGVGFLFFDSGDRPGMALFLAVSLLTGWACARRRERRGRYLPLALLLLLLPGNRLLTAALRCAPVLFLLLRRCRTGQWRAEYYTVQSLFRAGGILCVVLPLAFAVIGAVDRLAADSLPFLTAWLLLTVLNLRLLRNPYVAGLDGRSKALNAALLVCVALAVAALSSRGAVAAALGAAKLVWRMVLAPVGIVLLYILTAVMAVVGFVLGLLFWLLGDDGTVEPPRMDLGGVPEAVENIIPEAGEPRVWLLRLLITAGALLFLWLAWMVVRHLTSPAPPEAEDPRALSRESLDAPGRKPRRARAQTEGVREVYRRYLALCASLGIPVDGSAASDVIRDLSAPYAGAEDAGALREQWLRARFSGRDTPPEDVKLARQRLRRMRDSVRARRAEARRGKRDTSE